MRRRFVITGLLAAAMTWPALAVDNDSFHWQGKVATGKAIEIKGVNGGIHAEAATGDTVEVTANKHGHDSDPSSVKIQAVEHEGGVTICAVYPSASGERPNECKPGDEGHMSVHKNDVVVDFTVKVPAGVRLAAKTVNGAVEADALRSDVRAVTVNGRVRVSTSGIAEASTVNGAITASMGSTNWSDELKFKTVNGSVELTLPEGASTDVHASTVNGGISTDFPLTVHGRLVARSINGSIGGGGGGRQLSLGTVNGSIRLLKGKPAI